jgi:hypothetical protein
LEPHDHNSKYAQKIHDHDTLYPTKEVCKLTSTGLTCRVKKNEDEINAIKKQTTATLVGVISILITLLTAIGLKIF